VNKCRQGLIICDQGKIIYATIGGAEFWTVKQNKLNYKTVVKIFQVSTSKPGRPYKVPSIDETCMEHKRMERRKVIGLRAQEKENVELIVDTSVGCIARSQTQK
jgi:hypothetical protein